MSTDRATVILTKGLVMLSEANLLGFRDFSGFLCHVAFTFFNLRHSLFDLPSNFEFQTLNF